MTKFRHGLSQLLSQSSITTRIYPIRNQVPAIRFFSSIPPRQARLNRTARKLEKIHERIPEYPYGPSKVYKQSNYGLYGGLRIKFGNIVHKTGLVTTKARRTWKPNVHRKRVYSESLDRMIPMKITTRVLRTIDKVGGLDNYLLGDKTARIKELGVYGWKLRWRVMRSKAIQERLSNQRQDLGLPITQSEEKTNIQELFRNTISYTPKPKGNPGRWRTGKWRQDLWEDDTVPKLMWKYGDIQNRAEVKDLKKQHRQHKRYLKDLKKEQKAARDWQRMMPRQKTKQQTNA